MTLEVENLVKEFPLIKGAILKRRVGTVHAVNNISFTVHQGECFAIVGESGSGKTTTLLEIMDLNPPKGSTIVVNGTDTSGLSSSARRSLRKDIQIVFQDPMSSLNPRMTIREIIAEPLESLGYEGDVGKRVSELMKLVGLESHQVDRFPGHFSGGQRQRIGLARALATNPSIIVLDEPVSALDVSIQAGIINLLHDLKTAWASPWSSWLTTYPWCAIFPTKSPSCTRATSWNTAPPTRSSITRSTPIPRRCCPLSLSRILPWNATASG